MKSLDFNGSGKEYFKIWIVNVLLTLVSLGLYYPWAKVRNNRYFYANTNLDNRNFEYHATGKQLFLGYLISMAFFITYVILGEAIPFANLILILVLAIAIPWLIVKSMMFNMRMMSFSNVRFNFSGDINGAYVVLLFYPVGLYILYGIIFGLGTAILGKISPIAVLIYALLMIVLFAYGYGIFKKNSTEYFINNTHYGQGLFSVSLITVAFMKIMLKTFSLFLLVLAIVIAIVGVIVYYTIGLQVLLVMQTALVDPSMMTVQTQTLFLTLVSSIYVILIFVMMFVMAFHVTQLRKYIYGNTILEDKINFESTLKTLPFAWVLLSNLIVTLLTVGFAYPWAKVRMVRMVVKNTLISKTSDFDEYISQEQEHTSSLGDQLGDAFDIDVGVIL